MSLSQCLLRKWTNLSLPSACHMFIGSESILDYKMSQKDYLQFYVVVLASLMEEALSPNLERIHGVPPLHETSLGHNQLAINQSPTFSEDGHPEAVEKAEGKRLPRSILVRFQTDLAISI